MKKIVLLLLLSNSLLIYSCQTKNEQSQKIEQAIKLMQEAMMRLKEISIALEEKDTLDPSKFHSAIAQLKNGDYESAKPVLVIFSKGEDDLAIQALYWLGVCFMEEKNFEKAMITFVTFLKKANTKESIGKTTEMKKMANKCLVHCFEKLKRPNDACAILQNIEKEYPTEADYVKNARQYLKCTNNANTNKELNTKAE